MGQRRSRDERVTSARSASAVASMYDAHVDEVYRFVHRRCRDHSLAEDITQGTFLTAIRRADDPSSISIGWLMTVARNRLVDVLRREVTYDRKLRLFAGDGPIDSTRRVWFTRQMAVRSFTVPVALLALALAAWGGDDDSDSEPAAADDAADDAGDEPADDEGGADDGGDVDAADVGEAAAEAATEGFDFGSGVARVTVGDASFEFDLTSGFTVCRDVFGGLQIGGANASDDATVDMWIPPLDWESYSDGRYDPPAVTLEDDTTNAKWVADANRVEILPEHPPEAKVNDYAKEGNVAKGTATFINEWDYEGPVELVEGTFEVACDG